MALGANFDADAVLGRAGLPGSAAGTFDNGGLVRGMDSLFHSVHLFFPIRQSTYISRINMIA